eukprot:5815713-Pleurochrysis_carterae.AAC.5
MPPCTCLVIPVACKCSSTAAALADLRVGSQRMGPAKAKKLARVLMATRAEAAEAFGGCGGGGDGGEGGRGGRVGDKGDGGNGDLSGGGAEDGEWSQGLNGGLMVTIHKGSLDVRAPRRAGGGGGAGWRLAGHATGTEQCLRACCEDGRGESFGCN